MCACACVSIILKGLSPDHTRHVMQGTTRYPRIGGRLQETPGTQSFIFPSWLARSASLPMSQGSATRSGAAWLFPPLFLLHLFQAHMTEPQIFICAMRKVLTSCCQLLQPCDPYSFHAQTNEPHTTSFCS